MGKVIVVDGNIGVGKTTFTRRIAHALDMVMVDEDFEGNPYLSDFYRDQVTWAYKTQEWFVRDRFESYKKALSLTRNRNLIVDRPPASTFVFSTALYEDGKLTEEEYDNLMDMYHNLNAGVTQPDVYIYLDASPDRCMRTIKSRGRAMEQSIPLEYLQHLDAVWKRLNGTLYDQSTCQILVVDWENFGSS